MRTTVLSLAALAALAAGAGTADAQYVTRRGVVYGPAYPGYYFAPQYVVPAALGVAPTFTVVPAAPGSVIVPAAAPGSVIVPAAAPVVGYSYYPTYYYTYPGLRRR